MSPYRTRAEILASQTPATEAEANAQREASLATVRPYDPTAPTCREMSQRLREIRARSSHATQKEAYAQMDAALAASRAASRTEVMDLPRSSPVPAVEGPKEGE